jgi:hypothetical protein
MGTGKKKKKKRKLKKRKIASWAQENSENAIASSIQQSTGNEPQEKFFKNKIALPPLYDKKEAIKHSDIIEIDNSHSNEVEDLLMMFKDKG